MDAENRTVATFDPTAPKRLAEIADGIVKSLVQFDMPDEDVFTLYAEELRGIANRAAAFAGWLREPRMPLCPEEYDGDPDLRKAWARGVWAAIEEARTVYEGSDE